MPAGSYACSASVISRSVNLFVIAAVYRARVSHGDLESEQLDHHEFHRVRSGPSEASRLAGADRVRLESILKQELFRRRTEDAKDVTERALASQWQFAQPVGRTVHVTKESYVELLCDLSGDLPVVHWGAEATT